MNGLLIITLYTPESRSTIFISRLHNTATSYLLIEQNASGLGSPVNVLTFLCLKFIKK